METILRQKFQYYFFQVVEYKRCELERNFRKLNFN